MVERRRHIRASVDLAAYLVWDNQGQTVVLRNISASGALIVAPGVELQAHGCIRVEFTLARHRLTVEAVVRHHHQPGWIGVEFLALPDEAAQEIERYIDTHQAA